MYNAVGKYRTYNVDNYMEQLFRKHVVHWGLNMWSDYNLLNQVSTFPEACGRLVYRSLTPCRWSTWRTMYKERQNRSIPN